MSKKYSLITFGCQMNQHDAERISGVLEACGWEQSAMLEDSDAVIILTCCVRESAEQRLYGRLAALKSLKGQKSVLIAVGGCLAQKEGERIFETAPHVDAVFGTHKYPDISEILTRAKDGRVCSLVMNGLHIAGVPCKRRQHFRAWVAITHGCSNYCSYCVVPFVRGSEESRPFHEIIEEIEMHVAEGVKEINLLGQNVNSYGRGERDVSFAYLLREIGKRFPEAWIRFMTSHPKDFNQEIAHAIADTPNVCEYVHLPLQAGSDKVLKGMNRGYTANDYLEKVHILRDLVKNASLATDLIVGFPGESEQDFQKTLEMVELCRFDAAFTFIYNPRPGTVAARLSDDVPAEVKQHRLERLMNLTRYLTAESLRKEVGKEKIALVYGPSRKDPRRWEARTKENKIVHFRYNGEDLHGKLVKVAIKASGNWSLHGDFLKLMG